MQIAVPNLLAGSVRDVEPFYAIVAALPVEAEYRLDMSRVSFVNPYGIIALVMVSRLLSQRCGSPVVMENIAPDVHSYLERMNLFEVGSDWLQQASSPAGRWSRISTTKNLLELTVVGSANDVTQVMTQAERVFSSWLGDVGAMLTALSELCTNLYEHSHDPFACVLIQKNDTSGHDQVVIRLAVGDLGRGIHGSLAERYGEFGREPLDYLRAAMDGRSARPTGRGGLGLRRVEQIAQEKKGHLWLRSETAAILSVGPGEREMQSLLAPVSGTQVAVELRGMRS